MYGAKPQGSYFGLSAAYDERLGAGTFAEYDFVKHSGGELVVGTAGANVYGVAEEAGTAAGTGLKVNVTPFLVVLMDNDNDSTTFAASHVGTMFDFTGATGVMQVDTSTTSTSGQLYCLEYNPQGYEMDNDTSIGLFMVRESELAQI